MNNASYICPCCMENHVKKIIKVKESNIFKGVSVDYEAEYTYCSVADETYADEQQLSSNDIAMKNAYRLKTGLLTSDQIADIRSKYDISQADLCLLLGWGLKTITRYESHQVQDIAHDTILRKLDNDPEWFLELLKTSKDSISVSAYAKYLEAGTLYFEKDHDNYLKSAIMSKYARFQNRSDVNGNKELSIDVVIDMIHYYANSPKVSNLFLVKLLKMLWYADALSYKRYGHAISGLVYRCIQMGAAPVAYETIIDLSSIKIEEIDFGDGIGQKILPSKNKDYPNLSAEDKKVLDSIIMQFGKASKKELVETMHNEEAYKKTKPKENIVFEYAKSLSVS